MRKAFSAESIAKLLKTREGLLARLHAAEREEKALEEKLHEYRDGGAELQSILKEYRKILGETSQIKDFIHDLMKISGTTSSTGYKSM